MIPIRLRVSGFLSYREEVELDFTSFDLACITGHNGAGKSSLLDAITWALFGQARKSDDALINSAKKTASVELVFFYEGNVYRVHRLKTREKTTVLEYHILQSPLVQGGDFSLLQQTPEEDYLWKPLTERTLRETGKRIVQTLRLDYETFVNAAFFLQGKADQFAQQRPGDRKRILSSILGLDVWEKYRAQAADQRRMVESQITRIDGRLEEIEQELSEEEERRIKLTKLEKELELAKAQHAAQEKIVKEFEKIESELQSQAEKLAQLEEESARLNKRMEELRARLEARSEEQKGYSQTLAQEEEILKGYSALQEARQKLQDWEKIAREFHEAEALRREPREAILAVKGRLEAELKTLKEREEYILKAQSSLEECMKKIQELDAEKKIFDASISEKQKLEEQLHNLQEERANLAAENERLVPEMKDLKERIQKLEETKGAECPTCGQPLSPEDRLKVIDDLNSQGLTKGNAYRENQELLSNVEKELNQTREKIKELTGQETKLKEVERELATWNAQRQQLQGEIENWHQSGEPRLAEVEGTLKEENFALEARIRLAEIDAQLKTIGYDASAHDQARYAVEENMGFESRYQELEKARAVLGPLSREIKELEADLEQAEKEAQEKEALLRQERDAYEKKRAEAPDISEARQTLLDLIEQENSLSGEVIHAQQLVENISLQKERREKFIQEKETLARLVSRYKTLERAFSKDGVPALLIEQSLPEIEAKANEILERLSDGNMSVRFVTQTAYKDKKRKDLRETLDIQISDRAGIRDYEMFSGGEAFRINFAIRLALSEVLARRAGARLQTLVIDEGFGSQDAQGRQRLIEAINSVRPDFAKILVITHIDEFNDAFPTRIEVEKTHAGSVVRVN